MGIAVGTDKDLDSEELLRRADVAMYRAKERGRSRFEIFNEDLQAKVVERHETEQALRAAVKAGEFSVLYQPLIWLGSGALMGVEALVRWNRPGRGRLLPQEFIAVAEQSEIIVEIGDFVLTQACHDAAEWLRTGVDVPSVSVNVSVRQLMKPSFTQTVTRALDDTGLAPERLCLEITETLMIDEADTLAQKLSELRAIGVRVAMDDFGTGYASLAGLRELPLDIVKVDIRFVQGLHDVRIDRAIVAAVVDLAKELGIVAIAEGVETSEQRSDLLELDCPAAQGFLFSRPIAADDVCDWRTTESDELIDRRRVPVAVSTGSAIAAL